MMVQWMISFKSLPEMLTKMMQMVELEFLYIQEVGETHPRENGQRFCIFEIIKHFIAMTVFHEGII